MRRFFLSLAASLLGALLIGELVTARAFTTMPIGVQAQGGGGGGVFALVSNVASAATGAPLTVTTGGITTTGANLIVVVTGYFEGVDDPVISDSKSNTYTSAVLHLYGAGGVACHIWYKFAPTVGTGHTFTMTNASGLFGSMAVAAFSGAVTSPLDQTTASGSTAASLSPGSVTPTQNAELLVTGVGTSNVNDEFLIDLSYAITDSVLFAAGSGADGVGLAYLIQTTAVASAPTWTVSTGTGNAGDSACIATFK